MTDESESTIETPGTGEKEVKPFTRLESSLGIARKVQLDNGEIVWEFLVILSPPNPQADGLQVWGIVQGGVKDKPDGTSETYAETAIRELFEEVKPNYPKNQVTPIPLEIDGAVDGVYTITFDETRKQQEIEKAKTKGKDKYPQAKAYAPFLIELPGNIKLKLNPEAATDFQWLPLEEAIALINSQPIEQDKKAMTEMILRAAEQQLRLGSGRSEND